MAKLRIPAYGSNILPGQVYAGRVAFGDGLDVGDPTATGVVELIDVDAGAHGGVRILDMQLQVLTGFNDTATTSASAVTMTIGDGDDADRYFDNTDIAPFTVDTTPILLSSQGTAGAGGYLYESDDTIDAAIGGAAPTGSSRLELVVFYTVGLD